MAPGTRNAAGSTAPKTPTDRPVTVEYLEGNFQEMENKFTEMLQAKNVEIATLQAKVTSLESQVLSLNEKIDDNDAYERRDCIVFSGFALPSFET